MSQFRMSPSRKDEDCGPTMHRFHRGSTGSLKENDSDIMEKKIEA